MIWHHRQGVLGVKLQDPLLAQPKVILVLLQSFGLLLDFCRGLLNHLIIKTYHPVPNLLLGSCLVAA